MRQRSRVWFLATAMAAAAGCAHGGIGSPEGWSVMQSKHFNVYAGTPRHAAPALNGLEYSYAALSSSFFRGIELPKVDVMFLEDDDYNETVGFLRRSLVLAKLPSGSTSVGKDGFIVVKTDESDDSGAEALTHLFIAKKLPQAPLWFHEGFAAYSSTVEYHRGGGQQAACFGIPKRSRDTLVPLEKMSAMSWDDTDGDEARSWYKHTAMTLFDYVLHGDEGKNRDKINQLAAAAAHGLSLKDAMAAVFPGVSLQALDKKLGEHAAEVTYQVENGSKTRGLCPLPFDIPAENAADQGERQIAPASPSDIKAVLQALKKLPRVDGYPPWYPAEIVAKAGG